MRSNLFSLIKLHHLMQAIDYTACTDFPNTVAKHHILGVHAPRCGGYDP